MDIPEGALDKMATLTFFYSGRLAAYGISFITLDSNEIVNDESVIPKTIAQYKINLNDFMDVYIPIKYKNITIEQIKERYHTSGFGIDYGNGINPEERDFNIVQIDGKDYLHIQTNETHFNVIVNSGKGYSK